MLLISFTEQISALFCRVTKKVAKGCKFTDAPSSTCADVNSQLGRLVPPCMHIKRSRLAPAILLGVSSPLCCSAIVIWRTESIGEAKNSLRQLEICTDTHAFLNLKDIKWGVFLIYIWKQAFDNICIRWWRSQEELNREFTQMKKYRNSVLPISWWHSCREPRYERLSRNNILVFSSTLFKSISGSQGKAAWGAYVRFMSLSLSQDKDKKPQEKCVKSMSKPVSISEADQ